MSGVCKTLNDLMGREGVKEPHMLSPLCLSYIGDCVYDLFTRTRLICTGSPTVKNLHLMSANMVCATAQAKAARHIFPLLSEKESAVYKRARNAHMHTVAKNAKLADYKAATGLEAVIGYLYLMGEDQRLGELMCIALEQGSIINDTKEEEHDNPQ